MSKILWTVYSSYKISALDKKLQSLIYMLFVLGCPSMLLSQWSVDVEWDWVTAGCHSLSSTAGFQNTDSNSVLKSSLNVHAVQV